MKKVVVIGAGASGLAAALSASKNGNDVILLDKNNDIAKKILITGNGRCNYFNQDQSLMHYHSSSNSELIKKIINNKNIEKLKNFFNDIGIIPQIKNGYYYPYSNQAKSIKEIFISQLNESNIKFIGNYDVIKLEKKQNKFIINNDITCDKVILSMGGKSYPKTGSNGYGYEILKKFSHTINDVLPSLVSVNTKEKYVKKIDGVRCQVIASLYEDKNIVREELGEVQLTSYGLSGICIFNLSSYISRGLIKNKKEVIKLNFLPFLKNKKEFFYWIEKRDKLLNNKNIKELFTTVLNSKLIDTILDISNIDRSSSYSDLSLNQKDTLAKNVISHTFNITSTNSFDKAQVTQGGVDLSEINLNTMESLKVKNLYITGELIDLDADCGGYNLTIAFLTGLLSGSSIK